MPHTSTRSAHSVQGRPPLAWRAVVALFSAMLGCTGEHDEVHSASSAAQRIPDQQVIDSAHSELVARSVAVGEWAPAFDAPLLTPGYLRTGHADDRLSSRELYGHDVVLYFWKSNCTPCIPRIGPMAKIARDYHSRGVAVYGVLSGEMMPERADSLVRLSDAGPFPQIIDEYTRIAKAYGTRGVPWIFLIGENGRVLGRCIGCSGEDWNDAGLRSRLDAVLGARE